MNKREREREIRDELKNLEVEDRAIILNDYIKAGGLDGEIARKLAMHRKPAKGESPQDKAVGPVQTK